MEYLIVFSGAANGWRHEALGTAADTDIATSMVEGLAPDYARRLDLKLAYGAATRGINGGVEAGIELYDYATNDCVAVIGYVENDEFEEEDEDRMNTCAACHDDVSADDSQWIAGFLARGSLIPLTGFVCDDCRKAGAR
jgi:hypothetical protein